MPILIHGGTRNVKLQKKGASPSAQSQVITPDDGYDGLSEVSISAVSLQSKSATPSTTAQVVTPDGGFDGLSEVKIGAISAVSKATPSISVSSSGLITASATQSAGYVTSGTVSGTKQLSTQGYTMITPGAYQQKAVSSSVYTTGDIYVSGDANLVSSNIKSGISIFGVSGSYSGEGSTNGYYYSATADSQSISFTIDNSEDFPTQIAIIAGVDAYDSSGKTVIGGLFEKAETVGIPVGSWRSYSATKCLILDSSGDIGGYDVDATLSYNGSTATFSLSSVYFNSRRYNIIMVY